MSTGALDPADLLTGDPQPPVVLEPLLAHFAQLVADALAPRLADQLAAQRPHEPTHGPTRRLVSLDELVELLPAGKSARTWKRWLYERTRHNQVPGCHRIGNRLFFDHEQTIPWLTGQPPEGLDLGGQESLHHTAMPAQPATPPRTRRGRP